MTERDPVGVKVPGIGTGRAVEVLHDRGSAAREGHRWTGGSGYLIGGRMVLTAAHNVDYRQYLDDDEQLLVRTIAGIRWTARVVLVCDELSRAELALLEITGRKFDEDLAAVSFAQVNRDSPAPVPSCWAVGFPRFGEAGPVLPEGSRRDSWQVRGDISPGTKLRSLLLSLQVTSTPQPLPASLAGSEWEGMSGAVVFAAGSPGTAHAVGVISTHHRPEGESALTIAPITGVAGLQTAREWWHQLGVADPAALPVLPPLSVSSKVRNPTLRLTQTLTHTPRKARTGLFSSPQILAVGGVAFSHDGRLLASAGGEDRTVALWDPATSRRLDTLSDFRRRVNDVAFSPDGQLLAVAGSDEHAVPVFDPATGSLRRELLGPAGTVSSVAFSPYGQLLAGACGDVRVGDSTVRLWDPVTGTEQYTLTGHTSLVDDVAFSHDGQLLASASIDGTVRLWDPFTGQHLLTLTAGHGEHYQRVLVAFSPAERLLASGGGDGTVRLWDPSTGLHLHTLTGHSEPVSGVAFSPDGQLLASASGDKTVRLWDPSTGQHLYTQSGFTASAGDVAFSPDGCLLASACRDGTIRLWEIVSG